MYVNGFVRGRAEPQINYESNSVCCVNIVSDGNGCVIRYVAGYVAEHDDAVKQYGSGFYSCLECHSDSDMEHDTCSCVEQFRNVEWHYIRTHNTVNTIIGQWYDIYSRRKIKPKRRRQVYVLSRYGQMQCLRRYKGGQRYGQYVCLHTL